MVLTSACMYTASVTKRRKLVVAVAAAIVTLVVAAVVVVHRPGVQRRVWQSADRGRRGSQRHPDRGGGRSLSRLSGEAGPRRAAGRHGGTDSPHRGGNPGRLEVARGWRPNRAESRRSWSSARSFSATRCRAPLNLRTQGPEVDFWGVVEIGSLEITGGRASAGLEDIAAVLDGVAMRAELVGGVADASIEAERLIVSRLGRDLLLGPLSLEVEASSAGVDIRSLEIGGDAASLSTAGRLTLSPGMAGRFEARSRPTCRRSAEWWDPNLVTGLAPEGRVRLVGDRRTGWRAASHRRARPSRGPPGSCGLRFRHLELSYSGGRPTVTSGGSGVGTGRGVAGRAGCDVRLGRTRPRSG